MQLIFAPLWGRWSDRMGRRPLILIGIAGYVVAQVTFGLSTSLWLLYAARIAGGILSSATLPVSAAYVADMTTEEGRGRGMAWLGTAVSLGVLFVWQVDAPYLLSGALLVALALGIGWKALDRRLEASLA